MLANYKKLTYCIDITYLTLDVKVWKLLLQSLVVSNLVAKL